MTAQPSKRSPDIASLKEAVLGCGGVPMLAKWLGITVRPGDRVAHCPNAEGHSHGDRNPSLQLHPDGFKCHGCGEHGDALDLVVLTEGCDLAEARRRVASFAHEVYLPPRSSGRRPQRPAATAPAPRLPTPRIRPPRVDIEALWAASAPVHTSPADTGGQHIEKPPGQTKRTDPTSTPGTVLSIERWPHLYLAHRRLCAVNLARLDLVRILPLAPPWPHWPRWWPTRWTRTWRLAIRAFEPDGTFASLHARGVPTYDPIYNGHGNGDSQPLDDPRPKTRWPAGCNAGGLLFADALGLALLRGDAPERLRGVLVVEGLTDMVRAALLADELRKRGRSSVAVLGATSGAFKALGDVRWPRGINLYSAVDPDPAGNRYHAEMTAVLAPLGIMPRRLDMQS